MIKPHEAPGKVSSSEEVVILGGGVTGLAAARASGLPVYERWETPGGICASYYVRPGRDERLPAPPGDSHAYRFEIGGGHWIFGASTLVRRFLERLAPLESYERRAAVYFPDRKLYVPYPLQNHLGYLGRDLAAKILEEIQRPPQGQPATLADWLEQSFGRTLMELFFAPFHEAYTAGLWTRVAPQDAYKSPVDLELVKQGASGQTPAVGYNAFFLYPRHGLDALVAGLARTCRLHLKRWVTRIDPRRKHVEFADGSGVRYQTLLSTLPLNQMLRLAGLAPDEEPDPATSVLVLNIGAWRGPECPDAHWIYVPRSSSRFHRVGFYSNIEAGFAPGLAGQRVGLYVERAFRRREELVGEEEESYASAVIGELRQWGFITEVEVVSPTWVEVAYTWRLPGSRWRERALRLLEEHDILMTGRFGKWAFQGIADSIQDGLLAGAALGRGAR